MHLNTIRTSTTAGADNISRFERVLDGQIVDLLVVVEAGVAFP